MFDYILKKIKDQKLKSYPFPHLYIENIFNDLDFTEIIKSREIKLYMYAESDEELIDTLCSEGYEIIYFPGCSKVKEDYLKQRSKQKEHNYKMHTACESFGMAFRLKKSINPVLEDLQDFLKSQGFTRTIAEKFGININDCTIDGGIQKYLDGYEISPHPDIRSKALTFMININPHHNSENLNHHTNYLMFNEDKTWVEKYWENNPKIERCWVPWDWCKIAATQNKNNSMVMFSPNNKTLHGIKSNYDHLKGQRTQLYGNLWYKNKPKLKRIEWEQLEKGI